MHRWPRATAAASRPPAERDPFGSLPFVNGLAIWKNSSDWARLRLTLGLEALFAS